MSTIMKDTIITTKAEKWKNTASALLFITVVRLSTSTSSTTSSAPNCPAMSSVPREFAISTSTVTSATSSNYLFEQAGPQKQLRETGLWYAAAPEEDLVILQQQDPDVMNIWDPKYGDRMQKIVFIGQHLDKEQLTQALDACLMKQ